MFSVRHMPWHGLGAGLDQYPTSIDEALEQAGLGWTVTHGNVLVVKTPECADALIGSELYFETAGSLGGGRRGDRLRNWRSAGLFAGL